MNNKSLAVAVIVLIFILGILAGTKLRSSQSSAPDGSKNTFNAGWEAAKKRLSESGFYPMGMTSSDVKNLSGTITKINGKSITVKIRPLEPLADPQLDERVISIGNDTKIYAYENKDPQAYQKELTEYNNLTRERMGNPSTSTQPLMMPDFRIKKEADISNLKENQTINVVSTENIKDKKSFTPTEISIEQEMTAPPAAPLPGITPPSAQPVPPIK